MLNDIRTAIWRQVLAAAQAGRHNERRESFGHAIIIDPWGTVVGQCQGEIFWHHASLTMVAASLKL